MKKLLLLFAVLSCASAHAQGTFIYDQQSSDENNFQEGAAEIQQNQPIGQSFSPSLSSVGFIRLHIYDGNFADNLGGTLLVNLRSGSINGTILGSTASVVLTNHFVGVVDFFFNDSISVTPGTTYYLQPTVQSGSGWGLGQSLNYGYSGGMAFFGGAAFPGNDLWFREGVVVPEPSTALFLLLGSGMLWFSRKKLVRR